jgi:hypothetical protein
VQHRVRCGRAVPGGVFRRRDPLRPGRLPRFSELRGGIGVLGIPGLRGRVPRASRCLRRRCRRMKFSSR